MTIGKKIRALRKERGYTLNQLAAMIESDVGNLSRLERNVQGFSQATLDRIASALAVPIATLFVEGEADAEQFTAIYANSNKGQGEPDVRIIRPGGGGDSGTIEELIELKQYNGVGGGMGNGVTLRDQPGSIFGWSVTPEWIRKNIKSHSGAANLCIVTGFGNSMQPLYNPGDPLIIDTGVKSVDSDATYFFRVGEEGFIKILQRIPGEGIRVISKNKDYETWTIKPDMDFEVFGQVLKAWCGTDV